MTITEFRKNVKPGTLLLRTSKLFLAKLPREYYVLVVNVEKLQHKLSSQAYHRLTYLTIDDGNPFLGTWHFMLDYESIWLKELTIVK